MLIAAVGITNNVSATFLGFLLFFSIYPSSSLNEEASTVRKPRGNNSFHRGNMRIDTNTGVPLAMYGLNYHVEGTNDPKVVADEFLKENLNKFQLDGEKTLDHIITKSTPAGATVRYQQQYNGIPVYDSAIAVTINNRSTVRFVSSNIKAGVSVPTTEPQVTAQSVSRAAVRELDVREEDISSIKTTLIVYSDGKTSRLAWIVNIIAMKDSRISRGLIYDAMNGQNIIIIDFILDKNGGEGVTQGSRRAEAGGTDTGTHLRNTRESNVDLSLDNLFEKLLSAIGIDISYSTVDGTGSVFDPNPLATANAKYLDEGYGDDSDGSNSKLNSQVKTVTLRDIRMSSLGTYSLIGPHASYNDFDRPKKGRWCFKQRNPNFIATRDQAVFEAANTYYHLDKMMRYINEDLGIEIHPMVYSGGVQYDPHGANGEDNSYYDRLAQQLAFGEGGVDDAEDADVVIHELGHGVHDWLTNGALSQVEGLSEGFGDYLAASYSRSKGHWTVADPEWNWVFAWDGHNQFWPGRVTNVKDIYPKDLTGSIHKDGQIWSTCNMKIWDFLGREKSDKAHLVGLSYTAATSNQDDVAHAILTASEDLDFSPDEVNGMRDIYGRCGYSVSCGNGIIDGNDECDGNDIGDATCAGNTGCSGGIPTCNTDTCKLNYGSCEVGEDQVMFELVLQTDSFAIETSWQLENNDGEVIFSGSDYDNFQTYTEVTCMDSVDCFTFTIFDSFSDGMCCEYGDGYYQVSFNGTEVSDPNPSFSESASHQVGDCKKGSFDSS